MSCNAQANFFLITGGPGAGKSILIDMLNKQGFQTVPEAARMILKEQNKKGQENIQFSERLTFCGMLLKQSIDDFKTHLNSSSIVVFDRGLPDLLAYEAIAEDKAWEAMLTKVKKAVAQYRYNQQAFILPPWEAIYTQDDERTHTFEQAQIAYHLLYEACEKAGYQITILPKVPPKERLHIMLNKINRNE